LIEPRRPRVDVIVERPAALDVHKEQVTACVRVPMAAGKRAQEVREFRTTVGGLLVLHDWLKAHGVTQVAMEATGVYWKPVWAILSHATSARHRIDTNGPGSRFRSAQAARRG
jgi:transposase